MRVRREVEWVVVGWEEASWEQSAKKGLWERGGRERALRASFGRGSGSRCYTGVWVCESVSAMLCLYRYTGMCVCVYRYTGMCVCVCIDIREVRIPVEEHVMLHVCIGPFSELCWLPLISAIRRRYACRCGPAGVQGGRWGG